MRFESVKNIEDLQVGDIIRSRSRELAYIVTGNYGGHVTAVRTVDVTNPIEWEVLKATPKEQATDSGPNNSGL
jgi:hypothetical protein